MTGVKGKSGRKKGSKNKPKDKPVENGSTDTGIAEQSK